MQKITLCNNIISLAFICMLNIPIFINAVTLISLGKNCNIAHNLRAIGLRDAAYPFDWMISDFDAICAAFEDDFQKFLDPASLKEGEDPREIIDYYGLRYRHDFPRNGYEVTLNETETLLFGSIREDWRDFIDAVREKYQRRINRLKKVLKGTDYVYLIRYQITKDEALQLRNIIASQYPELQFTFIAVNDAIEHDWGLDEIKNLDGEAWNDFLNAIKLLPGMIPHTLVG